MKIKVNKKDLLNEDDAWGAVLTAGTSIKGYKHADDFFLVLNYLNELESGGHGSLITWSSDIIEELGVHTYVERLTAMLEKLGAPEYAAIERRYLEELWRLNRAMENGEAVMDTYDELIEESDEKYWRLGERLLDVMRDHSTIIYKELIEVVEE